MSCCWSTKSYSDETIDKFIEAINIRILDRLATRYDDSLSEYFGPDFQSDLIDDIDPVHHYLKKGQIVKPDLIKYVCNNDIVYFDYANNAIYLFKYKGKLRFYYIEFAKTKLFYINDIETDYSGFRKTISIVSSYQLRDRDVFHVIDSDSTSSRTRCSNLYVIKLNENEGLKLEDLGLAMFCWDMQADIDTDEYYRIGRYTVYATTIVHNYKAMYRNLIQQISPPGFVYELEGDLRSVAYRKDDEEEDEEEDE